MHTFLTFVIQYWIPASIIGAIIFCVWFSSARPTTFEQMPESEEPEKETEYWDRMKIVPREKREPKIRENIPV